MTKVKGMTACRVPSAQPDLCDGCDRYGASCVGEGCGKLEMPEVAKDTNVPINDCISRQAAIDAVNQYNFDFPQYMERFVTELRDAMKADLKHDIEALPSTQPEIVNCRDCKHFMKWRSEKSAKKFGQEFECECGRLNIPKPDDFCSRAKRKDDEKKNI